MADENGLSPHDRWIAFNRDEITLEPGEPQPVVVTLRVPDAIEESIRERLYTLDEATLVVTGHGPETEIGLEKASNQFVRV